MKLYPIMLAVAMVFGLKLSAHSHHSAEHTVITEKKHSCSCNIAEHWLYKAAVQKYMQQYADVQLQANTDTQGLSDNLVQAINMLVQDITFIDCDGNLIVPVVNAKGNFILPMNKNAYYKLCKTLVHKIDLDTVLSAQELYDIWVMQLQILQALQID